MVLSTAGKGKHGKAIPYPVRRSVCVRYSRLVAAMKKRLYCFLLSNGFRTPEFRANRWQEAYKQAQAWHASLSDSQREQCGELKTSYIVAPVGAFVFTSGWKYPTN